MKMRGVCSTCGVDKSVFSPSTTQSSVTNVHRTHVADNKELTIKLIYQGRLRSTVKIDNVSIPMNGSSGSRSINLNDSNVKITWDFSSAVYKGPEPVSKFGISITYDQQIALLVGDKIKTESDSKGDYGMISRMVAEGEHRWEHWSRVRFGEGKEHEVVVKLEGEREMRMYVDEKEVVNVSKLRWKFRGSGSFEVEGVVVDAMWDLGGWLFEEPRGCATVLLRRRKESGTRVWLEEDVGDDGGFSVLIQISQ